MNNFILGARHLLQGFSLISQKGVRHYAYIPMLINFVLFTVAIIFSIDHLEGWINAIMPSLPSWLSWLDTIMRWLVWPIFILLILVIVFFTFSLVANIIAAPFNGLLAEAVEKHISGHSPPEVSMVQLLKEAPKMIGNELFKTGYLLLFMIPIFLLSFIPVLNLLTPFLWALLSSWTFALDYHDYPMGNHLLGFKQQREKLRQHRGLALGFGGGVLVGTMIPLVNFIVIPAAVAGATQLYVKHLQES